MSFKFPDLSYRQAKVIGSKPTLPCKIKKIKILYGSGTININLARSPLVKSIFINYSVSFSI